VIDLHSHVLAGIDDGPQTIEGSVALARAAANLGVQILLATPHVSNAYRNDAETIGELVDQLRRRLSTEEVNLEIRPGAEVAPSHLAELEVQELRRLCLSGGPWLLLESPLEVDAPSIRAAVLDLQSRGLRVLLAHPERCPLFHREPGELESLVQAGVLTSVTAGAFVGRFGGPVRKFAFEMLEGRLVHSVASDAHDRNQRPPGMELELRQAGLEALSDWLTIEVPRAILEGEEIPPRPKVTLGKPVPAGGGRRARLSASLGLGGASRLRPPG
jgi:protein-tyrosine phosphatase